MRILMISDVYYPRINGVSTSIQTFCRDLLSAGHEITLVAPDYETCKSDKSAVDPSGAVADHGTEHDRALNIIRIPSWRVPYDPEDRFMHWRALQRHELALIQGGYSVVHIQTPFVAHYAGVRLARKLGIPCIETYHTFFEEYFHHYLPVIPRNLTRFVARAATRWQCNAVNGLVSPSNAMLTKLRDYGVATPARVIPTGLDTPAFKAGNGGAFRDRHGIDRQRFVLVHVGRLAYEKNIGFLLQTLEIVRKTIPDVLLVISGEGPARQQLEQQAAALNLNNNIKFVGYLSREAELADCYSAGDLFVFASRTETQGLVLLEALAMGVPVVSLAYMGAAEILEPETGAVIAPDNIDGFAACIETLYADPARRSQLSAEAKAYAHSWSSLHCAGQLLEFYDERIRDHTGGEVAVIHS